MQSKKLVYKHACEWKAKQEPGLSHNWQAAKGHTAAAGVPVQGICGCKM